MDSSEFLYSVFGVFNYISLKRYRACARLLQALKNRPGQKESTVFLLKLKEARIGGFNFIFSGTIPMVFSYSTIEHWLHRWVVSTNADLGSLILLIPQILVFYIVCFIPVIIFCGMFANYQLRKNFQKLEKMREQQEKEILINKTKGEER